MSNHDEDGADQSRQVPYDKTAAENCEYALIVEDVHKRYGAFHAVKGISFKVRKGTCFGVLGPNGAGKTSLLAMMEGLIPITSGKINVLGFDVATQLSKIQPHVGVQLQSNRYFEFLTVSELLHFYKNFRAAVSGRKHSPSATWLLERLGLQDKMDFKVEELSGGQKQRLSIAIALLEDPDVIYLDEPTSALDPQSRIYTWEFIEQLKRSGDKTIIITTHYMEEAERLCDEIMIMNDGKIIAEGQPSQLAKNLGTDYVIKVDFEKGKFKAESASVIRSAKSCEWNQQLDLLTVKASDVALAMSEIIDASKDCNARIVNIDIDKNTLEDVFLSHTGTELRE
jgi:ABC-2 type transport system ATP-binding protein